MTAAEYREALEFLGLSIVGAGPVLGVTGRQSQRYAAGAEIPITVNRLLEMLIVRGYVPTRWRKARLTPRVKKA